MQCITLTLSTYLVLQQLSLFQTNTKPLKPNFKYPKHFSRNKMKLARGNLFQPPKFEFFVLDRCLSFVLTTPLLTLITRHKFLTKTTILHFTSFQGTYSLPPRLFLLYIYGFAALYQKKSMRVLKTLEASFFPGNMTSSFLQFRDVRRHFGFVCRVSSLTS